MLAVTAIALAMSWYIAPESVRAFLASRKWLPDTALMFVQRDRPLPRDVLQLIWSESIMGGVCVWSHQLCSDKVYVLCLLFLLIKISWLKYWKKLYSLFDYVAELKSHHRVFNKPGNNSFYCLYMILRLVSANKNANLPIINLILKVNNLECIGTKWGHVFN